MTNIDKDVYDFEWAEQELSKLGFDSDNEYTKNVLSLLKTLFELSPSRQHIRLELLDWVVKLHARIPLTPITEDDETYEDKGGMTRVSRCPRIFKDEDGNWWDDYAITFKDAEGNLYWSEQSARQVKLPYEVTTKYIRK